MSGQDSESSDLDGKVAGSEESPGGDSGNTDGRSGIPGWLGWVVIVAVLLMMAAALVLGAQRFQNGMAAPTPTATSSPAIGSMAVEPQLDTAPVDEANAVTDVESGEPAADSPESTENGGRGADAAGAVDTTETVSVTVEQAPLASALGGQELLIDISSLAVVVVPSASRPEGISLIPRATEPPDVGDQLDNVSSVAAFGRMRGTARATEPTQESAACDACAYPNCHDSADCNADSTAYYHLDCHGKPDAYGRANCNAHRHGDDGADCDTRTHANGYGHSIAYGSDFRRERAGGLRTW